MSELYRSSTKWAASLTLPLFLVLTLFPEAILTGLFGAEYAAGTTALQILTGGFFFHALSGLAGNAIVSIGRTRTILFANVSVGVLNVCGNLLLVPQLGIEGAAVTSALSYLALNSGYLWVLRGHDISPISRGLVTPLLMTTAITVPIVGLIKSVYDVPFGVAIAALFVIASVHSVAYVLFGTSSADVELIETAESWTDVDLSRLKRVAKRNYLR